MNARPVIFQVSFPCCFPQEVSWRCRYAGPRDNSSAQYPFLELPAIKLRSRLPHDKRLTAYMSEDVYTSFVEIMLRLLTDSEERTPLRSYATETHMDHAPSFACEAVSEGNVALQLLGEDFHKDVGKSKCESDEEEGANGAKESTI